MAIDGTRVGGTGLVLTGGAGCVGLIGCAPGVAVGTLAGAGTLLELQAASEASTAITAHNNMARLKVTRPSGYGQTRQVSKT